MFSVQLFTSLCTCKARECDLTRRGGWARTEKQPLCESGPPLATSTVQETGLVACAESKIAPAWKITKQEEKGHTHTKPNGEQSMCSQFLVREWSLTRRRLNMKRILADEGREGAFWSQTQTPTGCCKTITTITTICPCTPPTSPQKWKESTKRQLTFLLVSQFLTSKAAAPSPLSIYSLATHLSQSCQGRDWYQSGGWNKGLMVLEGKATGERTHAYIQGDVR